MILLPDILKWNSMRGTARVLASSWRFVCITFLGVGILCSDFRRMILIPTKWFRQMTYEVDNYRTKLIRMRLSRSLTARLILSGGDLSLSESVISIECKCRRSSRREVAPAERAVEPWQSVSNRFKRVACSRVL